MDFKVAFAALQSVLPHPPRLAEGGGLALLGCPPGVGAHPVTRSTALTPSCLFSRSRNWLKWLGGALLAGCVLLAALYVCRAPLLRGAAAAWIVNDPATNADAIVVLGGGLEYRPFAAAQLYRAGAARNILITQPRPSPTEELAVRAPEYVTARQILLSNGVPPSVIEPLGTNVTSTRDEAVALRGWVQQSKAHSVVIPTDIFHTRRARWIFTKALRGTGAEVHVLALTPSPYSADNWWQVEDGLIAFQNEVVKSVFYHLKY